MATSDTKESIKDCQSEEENGHGWWHSWWWLSRRARFWRDSACEKVHPRLIILFLAITDAVFWCLVGIETLVMIFFVIVLVIPLVASFIFSFHYTINWRDEISPGKGEEGKNEGITNTDYCPDFVIPQVEFILSLFLIFFTLKALDNCVKKKEPNSNIFSFCAEHTIQLPLVLRITVLIVLFPIFSACVGAFFFAIIFSVYIGGFLIYGIPACLVTYFISVSPFIPLYVSAPSSVLLVLFVIALICRVRYSYQPVSNDVDVKELEVDHLMKGDMKSTYGPFSV